jgi:hypothetical protein
MADRKTTPFPQRYHLQNCHLAIYLWKLSRDCQCVHFIHLSLPSLSSLPKPTAHAQSTGTNFSAYLSKGAGRAQLLTHPLNVAVFSARMRQQAPFSPLTHDALLFRRPAQF